jgi:hypothetical protein
MVTAVMMFYDPRRFTVMDFLAQRSLVYLGRISTFYFWFKSSTNYPKFDGAVSRLAKDLHRKLRETDRSLWKLYDVLRRSICAKGSLPYPQVQFPT